MQIFTKEDTVRVKGIGILLLLFHHLFFNADFVEQQGIYFIFFPEDIIQQIAIGARVCVWIFAFLSAYGLTIQYENGDSRQTVLQFYVRRWLALLKVFWPSYIFVFLLYCLFCGNILSFYEYNPVRLLADFLGVANFFESPMLTAVWWYMALALVIIIIIPFLAILCRKFGLGSYVLIFFILQFLPEGIHSANGGRYLNYLLVIVLAIYCAQGNFISCVLKKKKTSTGRILEFFLLVLGIVSLLTVKVKIATFDKWNIGGFVAGIATFLIVILISKYFSSKRINSVLCILGKYSGNMFMIHAFLYDNFKRLIFWSKNATFCYLTLVIVSLLISILLEMIKKIIGYNDWFEKNTNKIVSFLAY